MLIDKVSRDCTKAEHHGKSDEEHPAFDDHEIVCINLLGVCNSVVLSMGKFFLHNFLLTVLVLRVLFLLVKRVILRLRSVQDSSLTRPFRARHYIVITIDSDDFRGFEIVRIK